MRATDGTSYDPNLMARLVDARDRAARRLANGFTGKFLADRELDVEGVRIYARHVEAAVEGAPITPAGAFLAGFLMALELEDERVSKLLANLTAGDHAQH